MTSRDSVDTSPAREANSENRPRVKPTHGAPTKTLLERQFVIWNAYIYILSRESISQLGTIARRGFRRIGHRVVGSFRF